jgi:hypothetical protein
VKASSESGLAATAISSIEIVPATNDPIATIARAGPALPF